MSIDIAADTKIALVTGASRGIGLAVAKDLSRDHHVIVGATSVESAEKVASQLPSASVFVADLGDVDAVNAEVEKLLETLGGRGLDVLVHSAGVYVDGDVAEVSRADWSRIMDINVVAVADLTRQLLPALRKAEGTLVTINSGSGFRASAGTSPYAASKFALRAFTDALREEERGAVRVSSVHPGRVDTDMQVHLQSNWHRDDADWRYDGTQFMRPESIAAAVRLAVDTGADANVDEIQVRPRK